MAALSQPLQDRPSRIIAQPPFTGRRAECDALDACLASVEAGVPRVVLITGDGGIGKSRLLREWRAQSRQRALSVAGRSYEDTSIPYLPFIEILNTLDESSPGCIDALGDEGCAVLRRLLRNDGGSPHNWLLIKCVGTRSNRSAIGTRVKITSGGRSQIDEVMSGSSYYSQNDFRLHFGLGRADKVDQIDISWPSGVKETVRDLRANHLYVAEESKGIVSRRRPR